MSDSCKGCSLDGENSSNCAECSRNYKDMWEKASEDNCLHHWVYSNWCYATDPPIYPKICSKCGKMDEEQAKIERTESYDEIARRFKK